MPKVPDYTLVAFTREEYLAEQAKLEAKMAAKWWSSLTEVEKLMAQAGYEVKGRTKNV